MIIFLRVPKTAGVECLKTLCVNPAEGGLIIELKFYELAVVPVFEQGLFYELG